MSRALRPLSETEVHRLLRGGGMLVQAGALWQAYRRRDARCRPAGCVPPRIAARLKADGTIAEMRDVPGRWTGTAAARAEPALPGPPAHLLAMAAERPKRVPLALALLTDAGLTPLEASRLKAAGQRFLADLEQAATPQRITMRWDGMPMAKTPRFGGLGLMQDEAAAALSRLRAVEQSIGVDGFRRAEALLADRASRRSFALLCDCPVKQAGAVGLGCLRALVKAYALDVKAPR